MFYGRPLFFISVDISCCYDSIIQSKIYDIMKNIIREVTIMFPFVYGGVPLALKQWVLSSKLIHGNFEGVNFAHFAVSFLRPKRNKSL